MKVWTTRDGTQIPVEQMTDAHLDNAIAYLERTAKARLDAETEDFAFGAMPSGDVASYIFDCELDRMCRMTPEDYLARDSAYQSLIAEKERRTDQ